MRFGRIVKHAPFIFASLWSIGMSIYLSFVPLYTGYSVEYNAGQSEPIEQVSKATLYEVNGPRAIVILVSFALLYSATGLLALKNRYIALAIISLLAISLTILASLSISGAYYPAAAAVVAGWIFLGLERVFGSGSPLADL
jgi:hypothetical protein